MPGILVYGEVLEGKAEPTLFEALGAASSLAGPMGEEVVAVLGGTSIGEEQGREALSRGASRAYLVEHPLLAPSQVEAHLSAVEGAVRHLSPTAVLMGRTLLGRDLGPRLAFRLGVGLANDCTGLSYDPDRRALVAERPVYGGAAVARVALSTPPFLATLRPKAFEPLPPDPSRSGPVERLPVEIDPAVCVTRVLERVKEEVEGVRLEDARVVVGGGRGLGGPEPFQMLEDLARILGGAVGASRAVCDAGWLPYPYQIGLTGKSISADLYIAVAISGASQHLAGLSGVKNIVAINKDPDANIFKEARFGVVGDWRKVLPAFIEMVRELVGPK